MLFVLGWDGSYRMNNMHLGNITWPYWLPHYIFLPILIFSNHLTLLIYKKLDILTALSFRCSNISVCPDSPVLTKRDSEIDFILYSPTVLFLLALVLSFVLQHGHLRLFVSMKIPQSVHLFCPLSYFFEVTTFFDWIKVHNPLHVYANSKRIFSYQSEIFLISTNPCSFFRQDFHLHRLFPSYPCDKLEKYSNKIKLTLFSFC